MPQKSQLSRHARRALVISVSVFVAMLATVVSSASDEGQPKPTAIDPPAPLGSTYPALAAEGATTVRKGHDVLMTWLEPGGRLRFARFSQGTWSQPVTVAEPVSTLDPLDRPSLTVFDTQAVRRTLIARTGDVVARSGDAGRTWARLPAPVLPFASFAGGDEGGYVFWLDAAGDGSAKLLGTRVLAGETLLDSSVASGSGTSAAMTWDGPIVVYRDHSGAGAQDIARVRRQDARWTRPRPVHHVAGWFPDRKPQSGPEVAALRRQIAVAWYTEAPHRPRVLVAFSSDAGRTFGAPVEVDVKEGDRMPLDRVDVALDDDGHALVLWMTSAGPSGATLNLARVPVDDRRGQELVVAEELSGRPGDLPQITRVGDGVAVAWTEDVPEPSASRRPALQRLRAVDVPLAAIPAPDSRRGDPAVADGEAPEADVPDRSAAGEPVPDRELMSLNGDKVSLTALAGRAVLLNLWATWCLPCIAEMPELAALHERHGAQGLVVVGLNVDLADASDRVRAFVSERQLPFPVWLDPEMGVYRDLRVKGLPATFVIDRRGKIVLRRNGAITADDPELEKALGRALREP